MSCGCTIIPSPCSQRQDRRGTEGRLETQLSIPETVELMRRKNTNLYDPRAGSRDTATAVILSS